MIGIISYVVKRDGRLEEFKKEKITNAIFKALKATGHKNYELAEELSNKVVKILYKKFKTTIPKVEDIQDTVEEVLLNDNYLDVLRAYILYREKHRLLREKRGIVQEREPKLTLNALKVLQKRYLLRDENGYIIETPRQLFRRVARAVAKAEPLRKRKYYEEKFFEIMVNLEFLPNSPTLMNTGTSIGQLSACFVLPVEDSLDSIFTAVKQTALIEQSGGGIGFSFSKLRPYGDIVRSTKGVASGPVSFMEVFNTTTEVIKSGGKRRGAMMGILDVTHPDIIKFITSKSQEGKLANFNISVAVTNNFMKKVFSNEKIALINPRTNKAIGKLNARKLFKLIAHAAWLTGDPGMIFLDRINKDNPTPAIGKIESTNPCGEQPLLPYESCNLGSINLSKFVKDKSIDWPRLREVIKLAVRFLDDVIDVNKFPLKEIEHLTKANRKIGLGVMGWAEMLIQLGIPYNSNKALNLARKLIQFIHKVSVEASIEIAKEKGSFPNFKKSKWRGKVKAIRNASLNTIAPTGSISIIAGTTSGIEPLFAVAYVREILEGVRLIEVNPLFEKIAKEYGFYSKKLMEKIARTGSIQHIKEVPEKVKKLFVTALDIPPEWHVKMQAAFQQYTDNAVSKTVNLPKNAKIEDVEKVFMLAWKLKCKGITVYRYGSKKKQVLYLGLRKEKKHIVAHAEYSGGCPAVICNF